MLSKSFESKSQRLEVQKRRKSYDFINFYEPSVESKLTSHKDNVEIVTNKDSVNNEEKKHDKKKNKRRNGSIDVSNIDESSSNIANVPLNNSKVTSTSKSAIKTPDQNVKSIMKMTPAIGDPIDSAADDTASAKSGRRKKRNKSVSFMLDDTKPEAKKSKSDISEQSSNTEDPIKKSKKNKPSKKLNSGKENTLSSTNFNLDVDEDKTSKQTQNTETIPSEDQVSPAKIKKKSKKNVKIEILEAAITEMENEEDNKVKKKKKRQAKANSVPAGDEPACKSRRKTEKPDMIAESLENLNLGSNAHTLTDLIDQMTVADKSKKKKKSKEKKDKVKNDKGPKKEDNDNGEAKEKIKWVKKKWNKGRRDFIHADRIQTSVIIENLPLSAMFSYKTILSEHFSTCGQIKQIGIAELYPVENPKPVFNTTVLFDTEEAATKALEEDNMLLEGNRIRVKRPLPYNQTTVVVRTYAELTEQTLSTMFSSAGRIRKIKLLVKGKKLCSTAFIEFDSADAVERAIKSAEGVLINRKKVNIFKYQDEYGRKDNNQGDANKND